MIILKLLTLLFYQSSAKLVKSGEEKRTVEYEQWECTQKCQVSHTGSSGVIDSTGAIEIFCPSVEKHNLHYLKYLGDGIQVHSLK